MKNKLLISFLFLSSTFSISCLRTPCIEKTFSSSLKTSFIIPIDSITGERVYDTQLINSDLAQRLIENNIKMEDVNSIVIDSVEWSLKDKNPLTFNSISNAEVSFGLNSTNQILQAFFPFDNKFNSTTISLISHHLDIQYYLRQNNFYARFSGFNKVKMEISQEVNVTIFYSVLSKTTKKCRKNFSLMGDG